MDIFHIVGKFLLLLSGEDVKNLAGDLFRLLTFGYIFFFVLYRVYNFSEHNSLRYWTKSLSTFFMLGFVVIGYP